MRILALPLMLAFTLACSEYKQEQASGALLSLQFTFSEGIRAQALAPETKCVQVSILDLSKKVVDSKVATPSTQKVIFLNLKPQTYYLEILSTNGSAVEGSCSGDVVDYYSARLNLKAGNNPVSVVMPRKEWKFSQPVNLNSTLTSSQETLSGLVIFNSPFRTSLPGYETFSVLYKGSALNNCNSGSGVSCLSTTEVHSAFSNGTTVITTGIEFVPYASESEGWVPLQPDGTNERFFTLVGAPPCTYKTPSTLVRCQFDSTVNLFPYMSTQVSASGFNGYVWEVELRSPPTKAITCGRDENLKDTFPCPANLTGEPLRAPPLGALLDEDGVDNNISVKQQVFQNVTSSLRKLYKLNSADYAPCNSSGCDYNLDGVIDQRDDTNEDGVINDSDSLTFYAEFRWSMNYDLAVHPVSGSMGAFRLLVSSNLFLKDTTSSSVIPVDYLGNVKNSLGSSSMDFVVWAFSGYDTVSGRYYGLHPKYLISDFNVYDARTLTPIRNLGVPSNVQICGVKVLGDLFTGEAYVFYVEGDTTCTTISLYVTRTDNPTPLLLDYLDSVSFQPYVVPYSSRPDRYITGFIVYDPNSQSVLNCDGNFNCNTTTPLLTSVSSFINGLFIYRLGISFFLANGYLYVYEPANGTLTRVNSGGNPVLVDGCIEVRDTIYCEYHDLTTSTIDMYMYDLNAKELVKLTTLNTATSGGRVNDYISTKNYLILDYINPSGQSEIVAVPKSGGTPIKIDFGGRSVQLEFSTDSVAVLSMSGGEAGVCFVLDSNVSTALCKDNAVSLKSPNVLRQGIAKESGNLSNLGLEISQRVVVVEECTLLSGVCWGGTVYSYSPDMSKKTKLGVVPPDMSPLWFYGTDRLFLLVVSDLSFTPATMVMLMDGTTENSSLDVNGTFPDLSIITHVPSTSFFTTP